MTVACSTILVGVFNRPRLFAAIAHDAAVGVSKDISFYFSFRFEVAFLWPSDLPTPNLIQLGLSLCVLAAKYAFVIFTLIMKYMVGHDRGAALLNEPVVSLPSTAVDLIFCGLDRAITTAEKASKLARIVRRLLRGGKMASGSAADIEGSIDGSVASKTDATAVREFELSIVWVELCSTVGAARLASSMVRQFSTKRLSLDLRDPPGQSNKGVLKSRGTLFHALRCDDEIDVQGRLSDGALGKLVESSCGKHIAHLDLASCARITAEAVKVVAKCGALVSLNLANCGVDGKRCWTTKSCLHFIRQLKLNCRRTPT